MSKRTRSRSESFASRAGRAPTVVAEVGEIVVERDPLRPCGRLLRQSGVDASYVDLADSTHLEFDYMRWMRLVLRAAGANRVLHLGGGACALARALATENPDGRQQVCEVDGTVLAMAREHMGLKRTRGLRVREVEGRRFLATQPADAWEAVVIDAFVGARVPRHLITVEALTEAARVAPLTLVNVVDDRSARDVRIIGAAVRQAYPVAWAVGSRAGNTVLVGARAKPLLDRLGAALAADPSPARILSTAALARLTAGTPALVDGATTTGPLKPAD